MIRGEGTAVARGVTPQEVFDFVLDPAQYTKADTKMIWVTKLGDTADGMVAREDGRFLNRFRGSVVTRYRWQRPRRIDVTLEHGMPARLHAWFDIDEVGGGGVGLHLRHAAGPRDGDHVLAPDDPSQGHLGGRGVVGLGHLAQGPDELVAALEVLGQEERVGGSHAAGRVGGVVLRRQE